MPQRIAQSLHWAPRHDPWADSEQFAPKVSLFPGLVKAAWPGTMHYWLGKPEAFNLALRDPRRDQPIFMVSYEVVPSELPTRQAMLDRCGELLAKRYGMAGPVEWQSLEGQSDRYLSTPAAMQTHNGQNVGQIGMVFTSGQTILMYCVFMEDPLNLPKAARDLPRRMLEAIEVLPQAQAAASAK